MSARLLAPHDDYDESLPVAVARLLRPGCAVVSLSGWLFYTRPALQNDALSPVEGEGAETIRAVLAADLARGAVTSFGALLRWSCRRRGSGLVDLQVFWDGVFDRQLIHMALTGMIEEATPFDAALTLVVFPYAGGHVLRMTAEQLVAVVMSCKPGIACGSDPFPACAP